MNWHSYFTLKLSINEADMKNIFIGVAVLFFLGWIVGFFMLGAGMLIHTLAAMSLVFWIQGVIIAPKRNPQE